MIHGLYGKLGAGKGLVAIKRIVQEITEGHRDIVTNVPLRLHPWVNGKGEPQLGLLAYLQREYNGETFDAERRVLVLEEIKDGGDMWLWRRDPDKGWFKLDTQKDEKGEPITFDPNPIKERGCAPVLCVTDEAWQFYPARSWQKIPRVLEFYGRQQRKLRDEWYIVTQHHKDVDVLLHRITQDFTVVRNHGMERLGFFRQPAIFRTMTYQTVPDKTVTPNHETMFRLDVKGLAQVYDTSAGVGLNGGFKADDRKERKGLNIVWLIVLVVILIGVLAAVPFGLGRVASAWIGGVVDTKQDPSKWSKQKGPDKFYPQGVEIRTNPPGPAPVPDRAPRLSSALPKPAERGLYVTGICQVNGDVVAILSDGRQPRASTGELTAVFRDRCIIAGLVVPFPAVPPSNPAATPQAVSP